MDTGENFNRKHEVLHDTTAFVPPWSGRGIVRLAVFYTFFNPSPCDWNREIHPTGFASLGKRPWHIQRGSGARKIQMGCQLEL